MLLFLAAEVSANPAMMPARNLGPGEGIEQGIDLQCNDGEDDNTDNYNWDYYPSSHHGDVFETRCHDSDNIQGSLYAYDGGFRCDVKFFGSPDPEEIFFKQQLSKACSNTSSIMIMQLSSVIYQWNDECVTDLERCYSVDTHLQSRDPFRNDLCRLKLDALPAGTTHWSVDCTQAVKKNRMVQGGGMLLYISIMGGIAIAALCCCRKCWREMKKTAAAHNESRDVHSDGNQTLFSMMMCGLSCLVQRRYVGSTAAEREQMIGQNNNGDCGGSREPPLSAVELT